MAARSAIRETTAVLLLAALLGSAAVARAENECGPPVADQEIVCSPSTYDPADGNIFYGPDEANEGDFSIRLTRGLSINYDSGKPGDDFYFDADNPENRRLSAVWVTPRDHESGYTGDISLVSYADIISSGRGISVGHYGASGDLRMEIGGGSITTTGADSYAIHNYHEGAGDTHLVVRGVTIHTDGPRAFATISGNYGEGDLNIDVRNATFVTAGPVSDAVLASKSGEGHLRITAREFSVETMGVFSGGFYVRHGGSGVLGIEARGGAVSTTSSRSYGIDALHSGEGDIRIGAREISIATVGEDADGVKGGHRGAGNLNVDAHGLGVETAGEESEGVFADHEGAGDVKVEVRRSEIATVGLQAEGVFAQHEGTGRLDVSLRDLDIATVGNLAEGVFAAHAGEGEGSLDAGDVAIATTGAEADAIIGGHTGAGDFDIRVRGGSLSTTGAGSHGVYGVHRGAGALRIDLRDVSIDTSGAGADGVASEHDGSGPVLVAVEGGSIRAAGTDASGVRMGRLNQSGIVESAASVGEDGYRSQTAAVNGRVSGGPGEGAGVFLAGGGRVVIGPGARLGAASGVAIRAAGDAPNLRVDVIGGRAVPELLGAAILNKGGDTVLAVNGVSLYESANGGRLDAWAPNGARDVALAQGFTGLDFTSPEDFVYRYMPRAAVYEALPGFLLRLDAAGLSEKRAASPGSPFWARISGGRGSYEPERSSVGAEYDFSRLAAEAGLDVSLEEGATGSVSVRRIRGSADVESPAGGGRIEAEGYGATLGFSLEWHDANYTRGRWSLATYSAVLSSNALGRLGSDIGAHMNSLNFEAGRHIAVTEQMRLTPRVWMARTAVKTARFTDPVNSRVSAGDSTRFEGGLGVVAETAGARDWRGGALSLRGSLDLAQTLGGGETGMDVSGRTLRSEPPETRLLLGLGGTYRKSVFSIGAEISAAGLVSGDSQYSGRVTLGWKF
ncbi:MAG: autotransporter outer membrane beta-barrel domain-containing protein [Deltaproteobacteria bacterium]|nr:autotransporter outer membrane beta-barrel domain-containing protein [Deltaproteobacteria bacterium]